MSLKFLCIHNHHIFKFAGKCTGCAQDKRKIKQMTKKISKGYRLKPYTHELINKIRILIRSDYNTVLSRACKHYYRELMKRNKTKAIK